MSHSRMLTTRRTKQRTQKLIAGAAKRAKKLKKQDAKTAGANAPKQPTP